MPRTAGARPRGTTRGRAAASSPRRPRKFQLPPPTADERDDEEPADGQSTPTVYRVGFGRSFRRPSRGRSRSGGAALAVDRQRRPGGHVRGGVAGRCGIARATRVRGRARRHGGARLRPGCAGDDHGEGAADRGVARRTGGGQIGDGVDADGGPATSLRSSSISPGGRSRAGCGSRCREYRTWTFTPCIQTTSGRRAAATMSMRHAAPT